MKKTILMVAVLLAVPGLAAAWHDPPPPTGLVSVDGAGTFWPYTDRNFSRVATDPINLVFRGEDTDPRLIRQILMELDGNRLAHPQLAGFTCTWRDAIGRPQTTYSSESKWEGSAIQLECGTYATTRVHLRLFRHGPYTLGGAHLEVQITGTTEHEVLSWIVPRELVRYDLSRAGFGTLVEEQPAFNLSWLPEPRMVRAEVLAGMSVAQRLAFGYPAEVTGPEPVPEDGLAWVLTLFGQFHPVDDEIVVEFDHLWGQFIPKPFCAGGEILRVDGPLHMVHRVKTDRHGRYFSSFRASGTLWIQPVVPRGDPYPASVSEVYRSYMSDRSQTAFMKAKQVLHTDPTQWVVEALWAGRWNVYLGKESCGY